MGGLTPLLCAKGTLTLLTGTPVLYATRTVLDDLDFAVVTAPHVHMTRMWGVWMCFFQAPLELAFAWFVRGTPRHIFVLVETLFEVALCIEVVADRRTGNVAHYSSAVENAYIATVVVFATTLLYCPDPVVDEALNTKALVLVATMASCLLLLQVLSLD